MKMKKNPIPQWLRPQFFAHMAEHDDDSLPDGAWFQRLEDAALDFMQKNRLMQPWRCTNNATHQYLREKSAAEPPQNHV